MTKTSWQRAIRPADSSHCSRRLWRCASPWRRTDLTATGTWKQCCWQILTSLHYTYHYQFQATLVSPGENQPSLEVSLMLLDLIRAANQWGSRQDYHPGAANQGTSVWCENLDERLPSSVLSTPMPGGEEQLHISYTTTKLMIDRRSRSPGAECISVHLYCWTTTDYIMDKLQLSWKLNNQTQLGFKLGRSFIQITPLQIRLALPTWALKFPKRTVESLEGAPSNTHPKDVWTVCLAHKQKIIRTSFPTGRHRKVTF